MVKRKFNAKARQNKEVEVDNSATKNIKVEIADDLNYGYDTSNALILPSKKRKTKIKKEYVTRVTKILSKKQRKRLEKIVSKKKTKEERASLFEALASVQISSNELKHYTPITLIQTAGSKKRKQLIEGGNEKNVNKSDENEENNKYNAIVGSKSKRKRLELLNTTEPEYDDDDEHSNRKAKDYNTIGFDSSESDNDDNDHESVQKIESIKINEIQRKELAQNSENNDKTQIKSKILTNESKHDNQKSLELLKKPAVYVHVERNPEIQAARLKLPILAEEQVIMELINANQIVILAGETGSGKTTQIPQFLYEAGYCEKKLIGITEPRRVAAISMSKRVAKEMNLTEDVVSYLIRFEGNTTSKTKIKFMTDGVLMKEIESDFLLNKYSVIILDEAHERSVYTDILVGLLSRIVPLRNKKGNSLKLIIMSATLRVEDFTSNPKLFKIPPPVINVEARQYPVTIHFQKHTPDDYVKEAFRKTVKIHSKLPEGAILIFVTGQQEVNYLVRKLRKAFPCYNAKNTRDTKIDDIDTEFDIKNAIKRSKKAKKNLVAKLSLPKINLDNYKLPSDDTDFDLLDDNKNSDDDDDDDDLEALEHNLAIKQPLWVLPLYSLLSSEKQGRVFQPPPEGCRLCVVSTNLAETSLTIPNVKYVVDTGRQKTRFYDKITGVTTFVVTFTSKASADQRAGRAGRVSAGHCYRLYSSAVFTDEFENFSTPDIQKKPVDDLMLQMKCMGIDKVVNFPFPSPPDQTQLKTAEKNLILLGALEEETTSKSNNSNSSEECITKVTPLGYAISTFPVSPRFGKMLALSHQKNLLPYVVCLVAALSVQEVLLEVNEDTDEDISLARNKWIKKRRNWAGTGNMQLLGDPMILLRAVGGSEYAGSEGKLEEFCQINGLRSKAITEIRKLRIQLTNEINLNLPDANLCVDPKMQPPTDLQAKFLRQILLTGMGDRVARKICENEIKNKDDRRKLKHAYHCADIEEPVFMHSSSVLWKSLPEWVIYQEIFEAKMGDKNKIFIRGITAIEPDWLPIYVPKLCNIKQIKDDPQPFYDTNDGKIYCYIDATYGKAGWELPIAKVEMPLNEKSCRYFGMYFLNGEIFSKLIHYKNKLKVTPSTLLKSWSNLNSFITNFVKALVSKGINSKKKLLDVWKNDKNYLLQQYCEILYGVDMSELSLIWPPLDEDS